MEKITLTEAQRAQILAKLAEYHDENVTFDVDIDIDGDLTVNAKGRVEIETETEYDYYNGTNECIETSRWAEVELTAYDEDGNAYEVDATEADNFLNAE